MNNEKEKISEKTKIALKNAQNSNSVKTEKYIVEHCQASNKKDCKNTNC